MSDPFAGVLIRALTVAERRDLQDGLDLAAALTRAEDPLTGDQLQTFYETLLRQTARAEAHVVALGYALGEAIRSRAGLEWIRLIDEHGEETSLGVPGRQAAMSPLAMVAKRLDPANPGIWPTWQRRRPKSCESGRRIRGPVLFKICSPKITS